MTDTSRKVEKIVNIENEPVPEKNKMQLQRQDFVQDDMMK